MERTGNQLVTSLGQGALAAVGAGIVLVLVGVTADERRRLLLAPLKRSWSLIPGSRAAVTVGTER